MKILNKMIDSLVLKCFLAALIFVTICSKSSFLYPLNDWGDANCYFTIGKGITHGMIPYRDLIDQKGPMIFFVYAIASLISGTSFLGVYVIELICATIYLRISIAIIGLYCDNDDYVFPLAMILSAITYSSSTFCQGGSAEELLLPVFAYGIYLMSRYLEKTVMPDKLEMFIWGILAGVLFYTKFSLCIVYICIILFMIINSIIHKEVLLLFKNSLYFILGCIVISIPVVLYFGLNDSLIFFWKRYFYNSIFNYLPEEESITKWDILQKIKGTLFNTRCAFLLLAIVTEQIWLIYKKRMFTFWFVFISIVAFLYMQFWIVIPRKYYGLPLFIYGILCLCPLIALLKDKGIKMNFMANIAVIVCMIIIAYVFTDNKAVLLKDKSDSLQTVYADEMNSYGLKDYHMLYFGTLDEGFYLATNTLPNCPAFITSNLTSDELKNIQKDCVANKEVDFIVTKRLLCDSKNYESVVKNNEDIAQEQIIPFEDFSYELIDEQLFEFEGKTVPVRLYKLND